MVASLSRVIQSVKHVVRTNMAKVILAVDDAGAVRDLFSSTQGEASPEAMEAPEGMMAFKVLSSSGGGSIRAVYQTPGVSGLELARNMLAEPELRQTPALRAVQSDLKNAHEDNGPWWNH